MTNPAPRTKFLALLSAIVAVFALSPLAPIEPAFAQETRIEIEDDLDKLPEPVYAMYAAIFEAARNGDINALAAVIKANGGTPKFSFGGGDDPIAYWKETSGDKNGREILAILVNILSMPFIRVNADTDDEMYIWPYLTEADLEKLSPAQEVDLYRLVKPQEAKTMAEFGGYIWYRLAISRDGTWQFFVAGD